jgi:hypothetical protein
VAAIAVSSAKVAGKVGRSAMYSLGVCQRSRGRVFVFIF